MTNLLYVILSIIWIYFFGWVFLGGRIFTKFIPKSALLAQVLGAVVGFLTAGTVIALIF
ncbi:MAG: hypothetical protein IJ078_07215 [Succinivibrionaceae bacterium]|jgi:hypothetical protein|nr:hypothetical protein [Succinivibrionaceae bacterium]